MELMVWVDEQAVQCPCCSGQLPAAKRLELPGVRRCGSTNSEWQILFESHYKTTTAVPVVLNPYIVDTRLMVGPTRPMGWGKTSCVTPSSKRHLTGGE